MSDMSSWYRFIYNTVCTQRCASRAIELNLIGLLLFAFLLRTIALSLLLSPDEVVKR